MTAFPLPSTAPAAVAAHAPGTGPGYWAGAPSALQDADGTFVVAYRVRHGHDGVDETVIARSADGIALETVAVLDETRFGAAGMERPSLVPADGGWRLYYCCAAPAPSKHWWIGMLEAPTLEGLGDAQGQTVLAGDAVTAVKDPIVRRTHTGYEAWICAHHLDVPGH